MNEEMQELKLYSPLTAELSVQNAQNPYYSDPVDTEAAVFISASELAAFKYDILDGIKLEQLPEEAERGLMTYFWGEPASVNDKVQSAFPTVEEYDGKLWGVMVCRIKEPLSDAELRSLKDFCEGQYSDGWGEGFEQRERKTDYGDLYVHFWQSGDRYSLRTETELKGETQKSHVHTQKKAVKHNRDARR